MTEPSNPESLNPELAKANRKQLFSILAVSFGGVLIAIFMYATGSFVPQGKTNKGTLILPPIQFDQLAATNPKGEQLAAADIKAWQLVVLGHGECVDACEKALYLTRQIRVGMGREVKRIKRLYLHTGAGYGESSPVLTEDLAKEHPELLLAAVDREQLLAALREHGLDEQAIDNHYIVLTDPLGNIMMYYTPDNADRDLFDDLKKLLKLSKIG